MIRLEKSKPLDFTKEDGKKIEKFTLGLGWKPKKTGGFFGLFSSTVNVDLDASCLVFNKNNELIHNVYFANRKEPGIFHKGDDRTGSDKKSQTDNEQIEIDLSKVNQYADKIVFTINSFTGHTFRTVDSSYCRVLDSDGNEVFRIELSEQGTHTALIAGKLFKENGNWKIESIGKTTNARLSNQLVSIVKSILKG